jgi:hypothetical protein
MKVYIYTLTDPRTNEIRYIGKANNLKKRLKKHLCEKSNSMRVKWISSLKKIGLEPIIESIEIVENIEWQYWECFYINLFKTWNFKLLNGTIGGEGGPAFKGRKHTNKTKKAIGLKMKNKKRPNCSMPGFSNPRCKVTKEDVLEIRRLSEVEKISSRKITKKYNIARINILKILRYERFKDV